MSFEPKPVIVPAKPTYAGNRWFAFSPKAGRETALFNQLHFERSLSLDWSPDVVKFCEYPAKVQAWVNGIHVETVPHFWVRLKDGTERYERVTYEKNDDRKDDEDLKESRQVEACRKWCVDAKTIFREVKEGEIRKESILLLNYRFLAGFYDARVYVARQSSVASARSAALVILSSGGAIRYRHLVDKLCRKHAVETARLGVLDLLREGKATAGLADRQFDSETPIKLS